MILQTQIDRTVEGRGGGLTQQKLDISPEAHNWWWICFGGWLREHTQSVRGATLLTQASDEPGLAACERTRCCLGDKPPQEAIVISQKKKCPDIKKKQDLNIPI